MQVLNKKFVGRNDFLSHSCSYIVRESKQKICKVFSLYMHGRDLKNGGYGMVLGLGVVVSNKQFCVFLNCAIFSYIHHLHCSLFL